MARSAPTTVMVNLGATALVTCPVSTKRPTRTVSARTVASRTAPTAVGDLLQALLSHHRPTTSTQDTENAVEAAEVEAEAEAVAALC